MTKEKALSEKIFPYTREIVFTRKDVARAVERLKEDFKKKGVIGYESACMLIKKRFGDLK